MDHKSFWIHHIRYILTVNNPLCFHRSLFIDISKYYTKENSALLTWQTGDQAQNCWPEVTTSLWSPQANNEAGIRALAFWVTIQCSFYFTMLKRGQLPQRCLFVPFTFKNLSLGMKFICMVPDLYKNTISEQWIWVYLL